MRSALVATWLATLAVITAAGAGSCSVDHRSGDFECEKDADCAGNRRCVEGFCEPGPGGDPDARGDGGPDAFRPPDADVCPPICTSCDPGQMTCTIDCQETDCDQAIGCPTGWSCNILCNTKQACRSGVFCNTATACDITCSAGDTCRNVQCGDGPCRVTCSGFNSCRGVDCGTSCACDVICTGSQSCWDSIFCTDFSCDTGLGCSSSLPGCASC